MAEKRQDSFTVTDRRLFTADGDLRKDVPEEISVKPAEPASTAASASPPVADASVPPMPTAEEQKTQADAYRKTSKDLDTRVELGGHSAKELEITFLRFMATLYMNAMLQLGLMQEEGGQPRIDLIAARQTVDTLGLLAEKTKGNLTAEEENFLQNCLYELRMAYVEVTNALARPPQPSDKGTGTSGR